MFHLSPNACLWKYQLVLSILYLPGMMRLDGLAIGYNWRGNNHKDTLIRAREEKFMHPDLKRILSFYKYTLLTILPDQVRRKGF